MIKKAEPQAKDHALEQWVRKAWPDTTLTIATTRVGRPLNSHTRHQTGQHQSASQDHALMAYSVSDLLKPT